MSNFEKLVSELINEGYFVKVKDCGIYKFAYFEGYGVIDGFATEHDDDHLDTNRYYNNIVCADNYKCWNKPRNCPLKMYIPDNEDDLKLLLGRLKFWGTGEGKSLSNSFELDDLSIDIY